MQLRGKTEGGETLFWNIIMSKIGKQPIKIPADAKLEISEGLIKISGPKGNSEYAIPRGITLEQKEDLLRVIKPEKSHVTSAIYGTTRANIANMVNGVSKGWEKSLEIVGTGFRGEVNGRDLVLTVGYSHPVKYEAPGGITFKVEKSIITISGHNKELVGKVASEVRMIRKPEPYKGKGLKYTTEIVRRKVGKAAKAAGATA